VVINHLAKMSEIGWKFVIEEINGVKCRFRYAIEETNPKNPKRKRQRSTSRRSAKTSRPKKTQCGEEDEEQQLAQDRRKLPSRDQKLKTRLLKKAIGEHDMESLRQHFDSYDFSKAIYGSALPFIYAVDFGFLDVLKFLANRTENPFSQQTDEGQTALMKSLKSKNYSRYVVEYLLMDSQVDVVDDYLDSALTFASKNIHCAPETFEMLLQKCKSQLTNEKMISFVDNKNRDGYSALMLLHKSKLENRDEPQPNDLGLTFRSSGTPCNQILEEALEVKIKMLINMGANKIPAEAENTLETKFWPDYRKRIEKQEEQAQRNFQPELSEYELERNARIERNQRFMKSLGLNK
tara:strand:- start:2097 stop:3146 length:1050 start_codon:yes stop_codon:yes gene_type:complete